MGDSAADPPQTQETQYTEQDTERERRMVETNTGAAEAPDQWYCFTPEQAETARQLCEAVVPGSAAVGPAVYLDSDMADQPDGVRQVFLDALDAARVTLEAGGGWAQVAREPAFDLLRAKAIEAYYSDFRRPGYDGPSAWDDIDFKSAPWAERAKQDWSFLRCYGRTA